MFADEIHFFHESPDSYLANLNTFPGEYNFNLSRPEPLFTVFENLFNHRAEFFILQFNHRFFRSDERIELAGTQTKKHYKHPLRLITAKVKVKGKLTEMKFLTNNLDWSPFSVCQLYQCRWGIEVFFKEIKQTLQLADFLGCNENAVRWQIWTALLAYLLLRFIAWHNR